MKRKRKPAATFAAKVTAAGNVIKSGAISTEAKIREKVRQLGIDADEYRRQANLRYFTRMASHPVLGIRSLFVLLTFAVFFASCSSGRILPKYGCPTNQGLIGYR